MVLLALSTNAVLFLTLGWINRASGKPTAPENWTTVEIFRAPLPPEPIPPIEEEIREAIETPSAPAAPEPMRLTPMEREPLRPRLVDRPPELAFDLPAITLRQPSVRHEPAPIPVKSLPAPRAAQPAGPMDLAGVDAEPQRQHCPPPSYPLWAKAEGAEGVVTLRFVIGVNGRVRDVAVQRVDGDERFGNAARKAVAQWRFRPATLRGRPVAVWCVQRVRFELDD